MSATATTGSTFQGVVIENKGDMIVLSLPGTDYRFHLAVDKPLDVAVGKRVTGQIFARARRVDVVYTGGKFVEPLFGRPRRVQGRISQIDGEHNTIVVQAAAPFICELVAGQRASDFTIGDLVSFDVERGARFDPI